MRARGEHTKNLGVYLCACGHFHLGNRRIGGKCAERSMHREHQAGAQ